MEFSTTPMTTRSRVVLEIAAELVADKSQPYNQAKVYLRTQGKEEWPLCLFGSSTLEGIHAVVKGEADLAMINPASPLMLAYRGQGIFPTPQPVRTIGVIPSYDNYVFAVKRAHGLGSFEDIGRKRTPLRLALRGHRDHWLHVMLDDVASASGFAIADIARWGGEVRHEGLLPFPDGPKFQDLAAGRIDAIFDEASNVWIDKALESGMTILPLEEPTLQKLEAMGYRRGTIRKAKYPGLTADVPTLDFSGWPIFVRADAPDDLVMRLCRALDARKHLIPWQGEGPLPVERMALEAPDTPQLVPLHPAAERVWRDLGYLR
jgi:TRAP-type uncharacterized transport system substrate-binding protein